MRPELNKGKGPKVKTIQINYPAPYYHQSWNDDADTKKKRLPKKLISPYKSINEVFVARHPHICPNNPILTLEKAAKRLEKSQESNEKGTNKEYIAPRHGSCPNPKREKTARKSPKKHDSGVKERRPFNKPESPNSRQPSPLHLKYGVFRKPPRLRVQHANVNRTRIVVSPTGTRPVPLYRAGAAPRLAVSEMVHLDIRPRKVSVH